jgi:hypothetical protein
MKKNGVWLATVLAVLISIVTISCTQGPARTITLTDTTVGGRTLVSFTFNPQQPKALQIGETQQFTAVGTYSDGLTGDITNQITWASSNTSVATISPSGLATAVGSGTTRITASASGATSPAVTLVVAAPQIKIASIALTPKGPLTMTVGATQQFTAVATLSNNTTNDISAQAVWSTSALNVANVSPTGLATAVSGGTTYILASMNGVPSNAVLVTVQEPPEQ